MDELELLKKDWQKKKDNLPKVSYNDIHQMLWKKSSSIVKWIFYISIIEFVLPHLLYLLPSTRESVDIYESLGMKNFIIISSILQYSVIIYFIYQFYTRYKEITVLDNSKNLMKRILKTRKTVKSYVIFSLSMILFMFGAIVVSIYLNDNFDSSTYEPFVAITKNFSKEKVKPILMAVFAFTGIAVTLILGGIYFLLYGILLKKLKINYAELKKLEV